MQSVVNTKMRKNIFYFYPLTTSPECVILYALTPKKLSRFCLQRKRSSSQSLSRWPLLLFLKSFNYISFFSFVNRSFPKNIFLFSLLTRRGSCYIIYAVCFLPGLFLSLSYRWSIKGRSSLEGRPFFISKSINYSAFLEWVNTQNLRKNILFFLLTTKENRL